MTKVKAAGPVAAISERLMGYITRIEMLEARGREIDAEIALLNGGMGLIAWTYFIRAGADGPVKIGLASDPEKRLSALQTGNHETLRIVRLVPGNAEKPFHRFYKHLRIHREWFRYDESMLTDIVAVDNSENETLAEYRRLLAENP